MGNIILLNGIYPYQTPPEPQFERDILFAGLPQKDQYWRRTEQPRNWKDMSEKAQMKFIEQEVDRSFNKGVWFANKGRLVHLPPEAYFFFNWWRMKDGQYPKFRYSQLYEILFEIFAEAIDNCIGTWRYKKRRDGLTTRRMCRKVWKAIQPRYRNSWCGIQSKTGTDAKDVCWATLMTGYKALPAWMKPEQSGSSDPKMKLEFKTPAVRLSRTNLARVRAEEEEDNSLNTIIDFRDTTQDAYDGQELLDLTLDEFAKWVKARALKAIITYTKCVWKDGVKVGHIHSFSSPAQTNGKGHDDSISMWHMADPMRHLKFSDDGNSFAVLKRSWFFLRYFTNALEGYGGACDIYGDCDQQLAYELIQEEIQNAPREEQADLKRQLPLNIDEILANTDDCIFGSAPEMQQRKIYLLGQDTKDDPNEPKYLYGNLEWKGGIPDTEVIFRPSRKQDDFSPTGKFCFQHFPPEELRNGLIVKQKTDTNIILPPSDAPSVVGIDPYDYRRTESGNISEGAALGGCALDFYDLRIKDRIWFSYLFRPRTPAEYYEDMLKALFYCTAWGQVEAKNKNFIDYAEDRGYFGCLLPKDIKKPKSEHKGNATTVNLTDEMMSLIDSFWGDPQILADFWMEFVLEDNLLMDPSHTTKRHLTMALGQMLLGFMKRRLTAKKTSKKKLSTLAERMAEVIISQHF